MKYHALFFYCYATQNILSETNEAVYLLINSLFLYARPIDCQIIQF